MEYITVYHRSWQCITV